ncbi:MAG: HD domain-containing phosphohydrolase [Oscillospiraceae bacterium]
MKKNDILEIGIEISEESNQSKLLDMILTKSIEITNSDVGLIYRINSDSIILRIAKNKSVEKFNSTQEATLTNAIIPQVFVNAINSCIKNKTSANIPDVYNSDLIDSSLIKEFDEEYSYSTKSMLIFPIIDNQGEALGVLQLINAMGDDAMPIPYSAKNEKIISTIISFSGVTLSNLTYQLEIKRQMFSFFDVIITAIDERTPYNARHTVRIVEIMLSFLDYVEDNEKATEIFGKVTKDRKEILIMTAWLHDIGKLVTPIEILNKSSRLAENEKEIVNRMEKIRLLAKVDLLEGDITQEEYEKIVKCAIETKVICHNLNIAMIVSDKDVEVINEIADRNFIDADGVKRNWLTPEEVDELSISSGTLTENERKTIQNHAEITSKLLSKMVFSKKYKIVQDIAGLHHELLNGKGYPNGIKGDSIPNEIRILTILDIFEALTTDDRPYKSQITVEKAFDILYSLAENGGIDNDILNIFEQSCAWENPKKMIEYIDEELSLLS